MRHGASAEHVLLSSVGQRDHQQLGAVEDALDLQPHELLGPLPHRLRGQPTLGVDVRVQTLPERAVGDPDEAPRLHESHARRPVGGLQQPRQHVGRDLAAGEVPHVATFRDDPVDDLPLVRGVRVLAHPATLATDGGDRRVGRSPTVHLQDRDLCQGASLR